MEELFGFIVGFGKLRGRERFEAELGLVEKILGSEIIWKGMRESGIAEVVAFYVNWSGKGDVSWDRVYAMGERFYSGIRIAMDMLRIPYVGAEAVDRKEVGVVFMLIREGALAGNSEALEACIVFLVAQENFREARDMIERLFFVGRAGEIPRWVGHKSYGLSIDENKFSEFFVGESEKGSLEELNGILEAAVRIYYDCGLMAKAAKKLLVDVVGIILEKHAGTASGLGKH
ncbi:MAG: hypothetical protein Hyperionvirus22_9 [Hyperionvirus sp.]|uniref:Uncharacterized protein n=1 Tax=Hyperionvirus sp. TaxID=2487770 RepID=A0A3G5AAP5_9VIRU|nr:MAG: hypothetical protein Hyperionvirus22_9 [Hyperionvirus sp.]